MLYDTYLNSLTLFELQTKATELGLSSGGDEAELISRINEKLSVIEKLRGQV